MFSVGHVCIMHGLHGHVELECHVLLIWLFYVLRERMSDMEREAKAKIYYKYGIMHAENCHSMVHVSLPPLFMALSCTRFFV